MMLADARTLCPQLVTAPADPAGDLAMLEKLCLWAQRWGPWSALDPPDGILVDITAAAHLFGGEEHMLADVERAFAERKLMVRAGIASTAGAAWALAHFAGGSRPADKSQAIICSGEPILQRLTDLPVAALRLDQDVLTVLRRLGLKRVGDLAQVIHADADMASASGGRDSLHRRFRNRKSPTANPLIRLDQLLGNVPEPLLPVIPQHLPMVQRRLLEPIRHRDLLDQVLSDLATDMARTLEGRGEGARRLELGLWRVDGEVLVRRLELSAATREADHITRLFAAKLDDVDAGFGIETVRLRASWVEPLALSQSEIEAAAEHHGTSLAACVDRLTVRLGTKAVRRPIPYASHLPERAQRWQSALEPEPRSQGVFEFQSRPLKMLDRPEKIA
ncbi:MAG: DNA polymerase Y family protein, partial [Pseudomonadota bacterium]